MFISVFDLFKIGIGPSSSHTVGPMIAAKRFADDLAADGRIDTVDRVLVELFGSLSATGRGHATDRAVIAGLSGLHPESAAIEAIARSYDVATEQSTLKLAACKPIHFDVTRDVVFRNHRLPRHPNALRLSALGRSSPVVERTFYSIGGGFVVENSNTQAPASQHGNEPFPFVTANELLAHCASTGWNIAEIVRANEQGLRSDVEIDEGLDRIWSTMQDCYRRGLATDGILPGGLGVRRRASDLHAKLTADRPDPLAAMDWVNLIALAVNEENAAGGRVVTAPTNGAAGIIPAVLYYYSRFVSETSPSGIRVFLLTATAVGSLIKQTASISGAEVGCQGEVGAAAAMAAGGLAAVLGGSPMQVENAAEIALEHSLGLTCDPVGGLVQVPCIERNAIAAVKAINAARLAMNGDGIHRVSLDQAICALRETGRDMHEKYRETAMGGLAVAVPAC